MLELEPRFLSSSQRSSCRSPTLPCAPLHSPTHPPQPTPSMPQTMQLCSGKHSPSCPVARPIRSSSPSPPRIVPVLAPESRRMRYKEKKCGSRSKGIQATDLSKERILSRVRFISVLKVNSRREKKQAFGGRGGSRGK